MSADQSNIPRTTAYELIGGAESIRQLHPADLSSSRDKLYLFLTGWMGGPDLYQEKYGHPKLRARHLPFPIGSTERNQWLDCMQRAMDEVAIDALLKSRLHESFFATADWMRNKPD